METTAEGSHRQGENDPEKESSSSSLNHGANNKEEDGDGKPPATANDTINGDNLTTTAADADADADDDDDDGDVAHGVSAPPPPTINSHSNNTPAISARTAASEAQQPSSSTSSSPLTLIEQLKYTLYSLEQSPSSHLFETSVANIHKVLGRAERYVRKTRNVMNRSNYERHKQKLQDLLTLLQEEAIDLVLRLNVDMPLEEGDDPYNNAAEISSGNSNNHYDDDAFLFPPMLHQVVGQMMDLDISDVINNLVAGDDYDTRSHGDGGSTTASVESWSDDEDEDEEEEEGETEEDSVFGDSRLDPDYVPWEFGKTTPPARNVFGMMASNSGSIQSSISRADRRQYYAKIQALRALPQSTPVEQIRVCLAQLDPGDTTPAVLAGQTVITAVLGPVYAFNAGVIMGTKALWSGKPAFPTAKGPLDDAKLAATAGFQFAKNTFLHFLLEIDLQVKTADDGGGDDEQTTNTSSTATVTCTLERCADDVYLYEGISSRPQKKCVYFANFPTTPTPTSEDSQTTQQIQQEHGLQLRDLIRFRNEQRKQTYQIRGNNCKDFVWKFLEHVFGEEKMPDTKTFSFNGSCQANYGSDWGPADFHEIIQIQLDQQQQQQQLEENVPPPPPAAAAAAASQQEEEEDKRYPSKKKKSSNQETVTNTNAATTTTTSSSQMSAMERSLQSKRVDVWISSFRK